VSPMLVPSGESLPWNNNLSPFKRWGPSENCKSSSELLHSIVNGPLTANSFDMARDVPSTITQGRVICRLVSMFQSVDELVDENDRRRALELDQDEEEEQPCDVDPTPEYANLMMLLTNLQPCQSATHLPRFQSSYATCARHRGQVNES